MKKIVLLLAIGTGLIACTSGDKKATGETDTTLAVNKDNVIPPTTDSTTIEWLDSTYSDLGKLEPNKEVDVTFRFKNTGTKNLIISTVTAQCGCTIPEKPEKPFAPGEEGVIKAKFNGSGSGKIHKEVYVMANTTNGISHTLSFGGEIISKN